MRSPPTLPAPPKKNLKRALARVLKKTRRPVGCTARHAGLALAWHIFAERDKNLK